LTEYVLNRKLSEAEVIKVGQDICSALELCSRQNIIHRDIKPENIFVSYFGDFKIGDFGVARRLEKADASLSRKGSPNYMAPEVDLSGKYDATVDIYSLGLVLYRLLNNNRLPFLDPYTQLVNYRDRKTAIDRRLRGETFPAPVNASPDMASVILIACAFKPSERFMTPTAFKAALGEAAYNTVSVPADSSAAPPQTTRKSKKTAMTVAIASIILVAAVAIGLAILFRGINDGGERLADDYYTDGEITQDNGDSMHEQIPGEDITDGSDESDESTDTPDPVLPTPDPDSNSVGNDIYSAYYAILRAAVDEHGISIEDGIVYPDGVHYAELLDFDNNGIPELVYSIGDYYGMGSNVRIYGFSEQADLLYEEHQWVGQGHGMTIHIATDGSGISYLVEHHFHHHYSGLGETYNYFTIRDGQWVKVLTLHTEREIYDDDPWYGEWTYYVNDTEVSMSIYGTTPARELGIVFERELVPHIESAELSLIVRAVLDELRSGSGPSMSMRLRLLDSLS
jgi:serine/threonine protein kinase